MSGKIKIRVVPDKPKQIVKRNPLPPKPKKVNTKELLIARSQEAEAKAEWDSEALLGLYYRLWQDMYSMDYPVSTFKEDLRHVELLVEHVNGLSYWCISSFFTAPELKWVKAKNLSFLSNPAHVTKYIVPVAVERKRAKASKIDADRSKYDFGILNKKDG